MCRQAAKFTRRELTQRLRGGGEQTRRDPELRLRGGGGKPRKREQGVAETRAGAGGANLWRNVRKKRGRPDIQALERAEADAVDFDSAPASDEAEAYVPFLRSKARELNTQPSSGSDSLPPLDDDDDDDNASPPPPSRHSSASSELDFQPRIGDEQSEADPLHDPYPHIKSMNFTFDADEVAEEIRAEEEEKREKARGEAEAEKWRRASMQGAWNYSRSACPAWDWFQGRAGDTREYTTLRHREYGYVVQLFDNCALGWFSFSRMTRTKVVYSCFSNGQLEIRPNFFGWDLVDSLVNLTAREGRRMPFKAETGDGHSVILRHSYWQASVKGAFIEIRHMKKRDQRLILTPLGFVFLGQPSYFQGGEPNADPLMGPPAGLTFHPDMGQPQAIWAQGTRRVRELPVARAQDLLEAQSKLWWDGDLEWKLIAQNAKRQDPVVDATMGMREEASEHGTDAAQRVGPFDSDGDDGVEEEDAGKKLENLVYFDGNDYNLVM